MRHIGISSWKGNPSNYVKTDAQMDGHTEPILIFNFAMNRSRLISLNRIEWTRIFQTWLMLW